MAISDTATILATLNQQGLRTGADLSEEGFRRMLADYEHYMRAIVYDNDDPDQLEASATMAWPDGSAGVWTRTDQNDEWGVVTAFTVTHALSEQIATVTLHATLQHIESITINDLP